ncbi:MAG: RNA polymerase sigma factor [Bauldia sp.]
MAGEGRDARQAAEHAARESYGRLVAFLAARSRDVAGAEDALSEAFASALRLWPADGVPDNPDAWLLTVARRRLVDAARRRGTEAAGEAHIILMADEIEEAAEAQGPIAERRLALMFACAHPAIDPVVRAPLILQTVLGLNAIDIGAAFLVPPATMGQRLSRAKARIRDAGIPFRIPEPEELPERLDAVLDAIYAAYAKGWGDLGEGTRAPLAEEAIWLGQLVVALLPGDAEAKGALSLMLFAEARRAARRDAAGRFVPLEEQDTGLWDQRLLAAAEAMLRAANAVVGPTGRYQIEAAIQSAHVARRLSGVGTWPTILALYDHLLALSGSPVVAVNRAAALAEVEGPEVALVALGALAEDRRLRDYQPYWAARGVIALRAGRRAEARESLTLAVGLADDQAVRTWLRRRLEAIHRD